MKKKRKLKTWVIIIILIICLGGVIYSSYNLFLWKTSINSNEKINEQIRTSIIKLEKTEDDESVEEYKIDFNKLKEQNSDTIAYLKVNNTSIDNVVVKGKDNEYYLKHNFNKEWNYAGWLFADYKNKFDNTDKNIIIYGHNMKDGSMLGTLRKTFSREWQENESNRQILLVTENETYLYKVFSTYSIKVEDYYIKTDFQNDTEYLEFLKTLKSRSNYNYNEILDVNDRILTLSTCTDNGTKRVVLHAKLINED